MFKFYTYEQYPEHKGYVWKVWMLKIFNKCFCLHEKIIGKIGYFVIASILISTMGWSQPQNAPSNYPISAPTPLGIQTASATIIGNLGNASYNYFIIATYAAGSTATSAPIRVINAPNPLTNTRYIRLSWQLPAVNATGVVILRFPSTQSLPIPNSCTACLVTTIVSTTTTTYNDQGSGLSPWTLGVTTSPLIPPANANLSLFTAPLNGPTGSNPGPVPIDHPQWQFRSPTQQAIELICIPPIYGPVCGSGNTPGSVTSVTPGCFLDSTPNPITTAGVIKGQELVNKEGAADSYTFLTTDCGKLVSFNSASAAVAASLPTAGSAGFPSGWFVDIMNLTSATGVTVTPVAGTIDNNASNLYALNCGARIVAGSDGNYYTMPGCTGGAGDTDICNPGTGPTNSIACGTAAANSNSTSTIAIGNNSQATTATGNIAIGNGAIATGFRDNVVIGTGSTTTNGQQNIVLGNGDTISATAGSRNQVMGDGITADGDAGSVIIGSQALMDTCTNCIAVGPNINITSATVQNGIAIGNGTVIAGQNSIGIGQLARANGNNNILIGNGAADKGSLATAYTNAMVIGPAAGGNPITDWYAGTPSAGVIAFTLHGNDVTGNNVTGANVTIAGGQSTGNANGGTVDLAVSLAGGAGATQNALVHAMRVNPTLSTINPLNAFAFGNISVAFAGLLTPADGTMKNCTDCQVTSAINNTCTNGGTGAAAIRINGAWKCEQ